MVRKNNVIDDIINADYERERYTELLYNAIQDILTEIISVFSVDKNLELHNNTYRIVEVSANLGCEYMFAIEESNDWDEYDSYVCFYDKPRNERVQQNLYGDFHATYTNANRKDYIQLSKDLPEILKKVKSSIEKENQKIEMFLQKLQ